MLTHAMMDPLWKKRDDLMKQVHVIDEAIEALKPLCQHEWVDDGHDSHYNWERCTLCRESQRS